jgi:hypothetical protein
MLDSHKHSEFTPAVGKSFILANFQEALIFGYLWIKPKVRMKNNNDDINTLNIRNVYTNNRLEAGKTKRSGKTRSSQRHENASYTENHRGRTENH